MDLALELPELAGRDFTVRTATFLRGPRLLVDGKAEKGRRGNFHIADSGGRDVTVQLLWNQIDPIPKVRVDGRLVILARPLEWYEYVWIGLPILMVFGGGLLGALVGLAAVRESARLFRTNNAKAAKFFMTGLLSLGAVIFYLVLAVSVRRLASPVQP